ncbi:MAG: hypothetical protein ACI9PP_001652, partial [Halobacteriales archaeon]
KNPKKSPRRLRGFVSESTSSPRQNNEFRIPIHPEFPTANREEVRHRERLEIDRIVREESVAVAKKLLLDN